MKVYKMKNRKPLMLFASLMFSSIFVSCIGGGYLGGEESGSGNVTTKVSTSLSKAKVEKLEGTAKDPSIFIIMELLALLEEPSEEQRKRKREEECRETDDEYPEDKKTLPKAKKTLPEAKKKCPPSPLTVPDTRSTD